MKLLVKIILPVLVVSVSVWVARTVIANKPQPKKRPQVSSEIKVEALRLQPQDYPIRIRTQGTVRPHTEGTLIPQVGGRIVKVSPDFRSGGFFEKGDVLLQIDPRDYEIAVTIDEAQVAQAHLGVEEAKAQAEMAQHDWEQSRRKSAARQLTLRKPQLAAAQAALASAQAQLAKARLNLERTKITAPYAGRVLEQNVDVGQYVTTGTELARIYAIDYAEIRLPISNRQLEYLTIPEQYRDQTEIAAPLNVTLSAQIGRQNYQWQGRIVRAEGAIDTASRQLFVIAKVDDPYGAGPIGRPPLRVGQFVEANIEATLLKDVFVIPRAALREGREVFLVDTASKLERRTVTVTWSDSERAVIADGLSTGELLALTALSGGTTGTKVTAMVEGEEPVADAKPRPTKPSKPRPRLAVTKSDSDSGNSP